MGLLDDAIREHLELKRLRGADPGVVAREEQEALGSPRTSDDTTGRARQGTDQAREGEGSFFGGSGPSRDEDPLTTTGQETAEIDMETVLDLEGESILTPQTPGEGRAAPIPHQAHDRSTGEESLEWEMPGAQARKHAEQTEVPEEDPDQVEDVLEETPDFLRDTPEQERLWFEQRPPRDFDFNE